jgi:Lon protease-like protein
MFPLGSVLLPGMALPLHVFEDRYRLMVQECLAGDAEFGVVLIERGSEVGGGDVRYDVGTVARIVDGAVAPDGRFALTTVGLGRVVVQTWLEDAPYPRAIVEDWPDPAPDNESGAAATLAGVVDSLRSLLVGLAELAEDRNRSEDVEALMAEVTDEPVSGTYQAVALSPLGPADRQRLLELPTVEERLELLAVALAEERAVLDARRRLS